MFLKSKLKSLIARSGPDTFVGSNETTKYWSEHNVTLHCGFNDAEESLAYIRWRNDQYFNYIQLMPVSGQDGKVILDYGCGPGHDLVGFAAESVPKKLIGADISPTSLAEAKARMRLHHTQVEFVRLDPQVSRLPFETSSIDYIHSSGVLHHTPSPELILSEFHRVLAPGGSGRIMVYNYDSLWLHLYVAYQKCVVEGQFDGLGVREAFSKTTDGEDCPISNVYRSDEFVRLLEDAGFKAHYAGAAISMHEANLFATLRYIAVQDRRLREESRRFLLELKIDAYGFPMYRGNYAGVDSCFVLSK